MAAKFARRVLSVLVIATSLFAVSMANKEWRSFGFNYTDCWSRFGNHHLNNKTQQQQEPKKIIVGGSQLWHFGYNYTDWAIKNAPFYLNDALVFKYDAPNGTTGFAHSVYLFPNLWSFLNCDVTKAKMVASPTEGSGEGFQLVLEKWQPYYFACGEKNGFHCNYGLMKFAVFPMIHYSFWP